MCMKRLSERGDSRTEGQRVTCLQHFLTDDAQFLITLKRKKITKKTGLVNYAGNFIIVERTKLVLERRFRWRRFHMFSFLTIRCQILPHRPTSDRSTRGVKHAARGPNPAPHPQGPVQRWQTWGLLHVKSFCFVFRGIAVLCGETLNWGLSDLLTAK